MRNHLNGNHFIVGFHRVCCSQLLFYNFKKRLRQRTTMTNDGPNLTAGLHATYRCRVGTRWGNKRLRSGRSGFDNDNIRVQARLSQSGERHFIYFDTLLEQRPC